MDKFTAYGTTEYWEWFENESAKSRFQIQDRITRIENSGHFGTIRNLKMKLWEIKFNDGRRIYYTIIPKNSVVLLLGGNKNGQKKDIKKAREILEKAQNSKDSEF